MADETINEILRAARVRPYGGHGAVYREMRLNYHKLAACLKENEPAWEVIAAAMARTGIVGAKGNPPNRKSLPKVWNRVCRDVAAEEAVQLMGIRPVLASRRNTAPSGWRPPAFAQPNALPSSGGEHQDGRLAVLPATLPPSQQPAPSTATEASRDDGRPAPGSIQAASSLSDLTRRGCTL